MSRSRARDWRDPPLVGKSAPPSFKRRGASGACSGAGGGGGGQSSSSAASAGNVGVKRTVANGLKQAQTQAIAVAGLLADVDSRQCRDCSSCLPHRASYHGRGD